MRSWKWTTAFAALALLSACWPGESDYSPYDGYDPSPSPSSEPPARPRGPQPDYGGAVHQADAPPAIAGGTLLVTRDRSRVVAADPDRDRVYVVDAVKKSVSSEIALERRDEPGRIAESEDGRVHVVLRRGGAIATIDPTTGTIVARRKVCGAPRGLAVDATRARLVAACEGGELVAVPLDVTAPASPIARLDRDLRDVVVKHGRIFVSRFRAAEVLEIDPQGKLLWRTKPRRIEDIRRTSASSSSSGAEPMVAFRMIASPEDDPDDGPLIVHEEGRDELLPVGPMGYYGSPPEVSTSPDPCGGDSVVLSAISRVGAQNYTRLLPVHAVLPVDVAYDGKSVAVVAAGNGHTRSLPTVFIVAAPSEDSSEVPHPCDGRITPRYIGGQPIAIASLGDGKLVVQTREPAGLRFTEDGAVLTLATTSREDTGHAIFHSNSGVGLACASCHPEGGDDGKVWSLTNGRMRTPSLRGTLANTAPYHWNGDVENMTALSEQVLDQRMNGPVLGSLEVATLESWLFALPGPIPSSRGDAAAIARGKALFGRTDVGCAKCHSGPMLTSGETVSVGTGGYFQIPSLVGVAARAPYFHDGCANTLEGHFTACNVHDHSVPTLGAAAKADLLAYLESL